MHHLPTHLTKESGNLPGVSGDSSNFLHLPIICIAMLGDLMERTSLAEALDKLNSDVAAQHAAGLDALKTWLQVLRIRDLKVGMGQTPT